MADVHNADASQLHVVADKLRRRADKAALAQLADVDGVVGDETVTSLYKLKRSLALADAGVAGQKQTFAVYLDKHAVYRRAGGKVKVQRAYDVRHEVGGVLRRRKNVAVILPRRLDAFGERRSAVAYDECGNVPFKKVVKAAPALVLGFKLQIGAFDPAHDLEPLGVEVVVKARKLQCGTVDVRRGEQPFLVVLRGVQRQKVVFLRQCFELYGILSCHMRLSLLCYSIILYYIYARGLRQARRAGQRAQGSAIYFMKKCLAIAVIVCYYI